MKHFIEVEISDSTYCSGCTFEVDREVRSECIHPGIEGCLVDVKDYRGVCLAKRSSECLNLYGVK